MSADNASSNISAQRLWALTLSSIGVVFGDIGTSPLYTLREVFHHGLALTPENIIGVLSLIFWSVTIAVTGKYVMVLLRADNRGEGGIMALMALTMRAKDGRNRKVFLMTLGIVGAALFYGDCVITPAMSVLGAAEGLNLISSSLTPIVIPASIAILCLLFVIQKHGTHSVGKYFGPIMIAWFIILAGLGIKEIVTYPQVLLAVNPLYMFHFAMEHKLGAFLCLGAVVLALTGGEALYADVGHFGRKPIRNAWIFFVFPALMLNYFGQGALLLQHPEALVNPFYLLAPKWALIPMIILSTLATVIASQAVITGAYSVTRQAIQLGYWPRMEIIQTSESERGQIYMPTVNRLLLVAVISVILHFQTSSNMASAYGIAVTATMTIDTLLAYEVVRRLWNWPRWWAMPLFGVFLICDLLLLSSNSLKIPEGGWFPLLLGAAVFALMITWKQGRELLLDKLRKNAMPIQEFLTSLSEGSGAHRVSGTSVFLSASSGWVPHALIHNLYHNKILHERIFLLTIQLEEQPHVRKDQRLVVTDLGQGFYSVEVHYGFKDRTDVMRTLKLLDEKGLKFRLMETSFFATRQSVTTNMKDTGLNQLRWSVFAYMLRNSRNATDFFQIPPNRVIEVGSQMAI
jgi:KUP system potassium uptake protein